MSWRVLQWSTGNVGRASLRAVLAHPELELAGVFAHGQDKEGVDAGALLGRDEIGVAATTDLDAALALDADCVLHMPLPSQRYGDDPGRDLEDLCRMLRAGKNVITTVGYLYPKAHGAEVVGRLEAACAEGGASLHGTGMNPGWLADVLPLTMSGLSERIDRITVLESTDFSFYPSREVIFEMMGLGRTPEQFEASSERYVGWLTGLFRESLWMLADGLALPLEEEKRSVEWVLAEEAVDIAAGRIEPGTIAAQRFRWTGRHGGQERIALEAVYRAAANVAPDWAAPGCKVEIEGRPRLVLDVGEGWVSNGLAATAMHAVHAVPHVCQAEPGIRTFLDLPLILGRHAFRGARAVDERPPAS
jgi:4-hydroxy-tetrahydrodipicolinate reductase